MDGSAPSISPHELYALLGAASSPLLLDVRRADAFDADNHLIVSAIHLAPDAIAGLQSDLPTNREVIAYCVHGHEVSQSAAATMRRAGIAAAYLEGGIAAWKERDLPTRRKSDVVVDKWVTREHPKIDRVACPWLVLRFIHPNAAFLYVPPNEVLAVARARDATPYDVQDVVFGHVGDQCSFDAIIRHFGIDDPGLAQLATIVRGADTSRRDLAPQCEGLLAISYGLSAKYPDDHEMLKHGLVMYDALYAWCRMQQRKPRH